jgi:isocitrate dehydrogenase
MPNLYGDILSDVAAQITGSVGLAGSANIGEECSMFEAIHGSAPLIAGQNIANPSGLIHGAVMMLNHIGQTAVAEKIMNAWLKTLEDGLHTFDIYTEGLSKQKLGTIEFAEAVVSNLGATPTLLKAVEYSNNKALKLPKYKRKEAAAKELVGVDLFVHWRGENPNELATIVQKIESNNAKLTMITNRGIKVWPNGFEETFCTDHWRCRFTSENNLGLNNTDVIELLSKCIDQKIDVVKTENLYKFNGQIAFSLGQGQ